MKAAVPNQPCLPLTAEKVADMMLPAAEIAINVPDAVRVFGEGPNTYVDGLSWDWKTLSVVG